MDLDTDAAIWAESPFQLRTRPGMGYGDRHEHGPTMVAKGGSVPGFVSEIILYPNSDSGVFVSINTNPYGTRGASPVSALQVAESVYAATQE